MSDLTITALDGATLYMMGEYTLGIGCGPMHSCYREGDHPVTGTPIAHSVEVWVTHNPTGGYATHRVFGELVSVEQAYITHVPVKRLAEFLLRFVTFVEGVS